MQENFIIYKEEYDLIKKILASLKAYTMSEIVFITDSEGHCIASTGEMNDTYLNSISSLIAGSIAAVNSIGKMINVNEFTSLLTESLTKSLYVSSINERTMLVTVFSKESNLGLIRFRLKGAIKELKDIFVTINEKLKSNVFKEEVFPFEGVTDEDIDEIFGD